MTKKYLLILVNLMIYFTACSQHKHQHNHNENKDTNAANQHMHRSSTEDLVKHLESPERDDYQQPEKVLEYLGDLENKRIMDIGAGSGYFSIKLADKGAQVIAADVNDEFQAAIEKRIAEHKLENIELRKIPYDNPGLAEQEVNMVFIVNTYHHIEDRSEYFAKVKAGTKADGELVLIDFFKTDVPVGPPVDHKISIDQVIAELKESGYTSFEVNVDLLPYQYIIRAK